MRAEDLLNRLQDHTFRPFRVHLSDRTSLDIIGRDMVIVGRSSAVLPSRFGKDDEGRRIAERWRTVDMLHMVQFSDLDEHVNGRRRRKR